MEFLLHYCYSILLRSFCVIDCFTLCTLINSISSYHYGIKQEVLCFLIFMFNFGSGRGKAFDMRNDREKTRGRGGESGSGKDKIDALGRLL